MNFISSVDVPGVAAAYEAQVRQICHGRFPPALRLEDRLDPQRWALEWQLADWLGEALGIDPETRRQITLSSILGLVSIRLVDDIADGDLADEFGGLAAALLDTALTPYRERFPPGSKFWAGVERYMTTWRQAIAQPADRGAQALSARGAPLKIPALAICLIAGRGRDVSSIEEMLDHALVAMVLYDHVVDWRDDIAGPWNAFVEHTLGTNAAVSERSMTVALLTGSSIPRYFARIELELSSAADIAGRLRITGLRRHLARLRTQLGEQGRDLMARYSEFAARGQELLFGHQIS